MGESRECIPNKPADGTSSSLLHYINSNRLDHQQRQARSRHNKRGPKHDNQNIEKATRLLHRQLDQCRECVNNDSRRIKGHPFLGYLRKTCRIGIFIRTCRAERAAYNQYDKEEDCSGGEVVKIETAPVGNNSGYDQKASQHDRNAATMLFVILPQNQPKAIQTSTPFLIKNDILILRWAEQDTDYATTNRNI